MATPAARTRPPATSRRLLRFFRCDSCEGGRIGQRGDGRGIRRCQRLLEQPAVDRVRLRRGVRSELVGEQATAALVRTERFRVVPGCRLGLHQQAVPAFPVRLQLDELLGCPDRGSRIPAEPVRHCEALEGSNERLSELRALLLHPASVLTREKRVSRERLRGRRLRAGALDVSRRKRELGGRDGFVGSHDVDPGPGWEHELVAPERTGQSFGAVQAAIVQE